MASRPSTAPRDSRASASGRRRQPGRARAAACGTGDPLETFRAWFAARGWEPFPFQEETWAAAVAGTSGLVHAPTGTGKTLAAW
ncbi:MAG: hypothetical protein ACR2IT_06175, partial [Pirellulales bacterium]